jgi:hypothetical protein
MLSHSLGRFDQHTSYHYLAGIALSAIGSELFPRGPCKIIFPVYEHLIPRHKYILKHHEGFILTTEKILCIQGLPSCFLASQD